jgi:hypothetical protein
MKKLALTLLVSICLLTLAQAQIVITEIMYNPPESGTDSLEYIELYNNSSATVNLGDWNFTQGIAYTIPAGTTLGAGQYLLIAKSAAAMQNVFAKTALQWTVPADALTNGGEDIELRDASGNVIDYVDYKNVAPWPTEPAGNGPSLALCDPNSDNNDPVNWQGAVTPTGIIINGKEVIANPGAASNCTGGNQISANNDNATVINGTPAVIAALLNDLKPNPITSITITTAPANGTATVNSFGEIVYNNNAGFCGADSLIYQICDANGCDDAKIFLNVKCYDAYSLSSLSTDNPDGTPFYLNQNVEITGTVYGVNLRPLTGTVPSLLFTIIDDNGDAGIAISSINGNFGYSVNEKDRVKVLGTVVNQSGLTSVQPDQISIISFNNPLLSPLAVTKPEEVTESRLIRINNLHFVDPSEWTTGSGGSGFNVRAVSDAAPLDTVLIRIDRDVSCYNAPLPAEPFNLIGLGGQFDNTAPYNTGYQVLPRYNADISTLPSATKEADFSAEVKISPNPAQDFAVISTTVPFQRISILSATGQKVLEINKPSQEELVPLRQLSAGTYFVRFEKGGAFWVTQLIKQ